jgi:RNA polymerase sigma-70 factor (ECF subfamily)
VDVVTGAAVEVLAIPEPESAVDGLSGASTAFEDLYHRHVGRVFALCLRLAGDPARAEDLAQETFVRAWSRLDTYRGGSDGFLAWLRAIAVHVVISDRRSRRRRRWKEEPVDERFVGEAPGPRPEPGAALDLERAISALPAGAREVFVLHEIEGLRHDEVAALLSVAVGTSKAQLHRARKLLREALAP